MSQGKGDWRRPAAVDPETVAKNWDRVFQKPDPTPPKRQPEQKPAAQSMTQVCNNWYDPTPTSRYADGYTRTFGSKAVMAETRAPRADAKIQAVMTAMRDLHRSEPAA